MISYKINYNLIKEGEKIMAELMASNFVHNAIDEDLKEGKYTEGIHKWIFTYWTCKIHMLKFRYSSKI